MYIRPFTKEIEQKAKKELNEVQSRKNAHLKNIREWLQKQPHLNARTEELWLLNFLRGSKFSSQRTKEKIEAFYRMKSTVPELFGNRDPLQPEIQEVLSRGILIPISTADKEVLLIRWQNADPNKISLQTVVKVGLMMFDIYMHENDTFMIIGHQVIDDFKGFSLTYLKQCSPLLFQRIIDVVRKAYPIRLKVFHVINCPSLYDVLFSMARPCLSKKIISRVKTYKEQDFTKLYKDIPLAALPKEYGGEGDSVDELAAKWKKKIESYRQWFLDDEIYRFDESQQPGHIDTDYDIFGKEGSFRQLEID